LDPYLSAADPTELEVLSFEEVLQKHSLDQPAASSKKILAPDGTIIAIRNTFG